MRVRLHYAVGNGAVIISMYRNDSHIQLNAHLCERLPKTFPSHFSSSVDEFHAFVLRKYRMDDLVAFNVVGFPTKLMSNRQNCANESAT